MVMICPECGAENPDHADFCNLCHTTVGFEDVEYCAPPAFDEGYGNKYPSSFSEDAPVPPRDSFTHLPDAPPVDIGQYGRRSGEQVPAGAVPPLPEASAGPDVGQYGVRSGHELHEMGVSQADYGYEPHEVSRRRIKKEARRLRKERRGG